MTERPSIAPSIAKIDRADENLRNLDRDFRAFINDAPYVAVPDDDPNPETRAFRIVSVKNVAPRLCVLVGEVAHHLRSAFDLLVYQLMIDAGVADNKLLELCAFPVLTHDRSDPVQAKEYERLIRRKIECVCPRAKALIEMLQPCNGHRESSWFITRIDTLDKTDKHRLLLALISGVHIGGWTFSDDTGGVVTMPHDATIPLQPDAILKIGSVKPDMNVQPNLPLVVTFGESGVFWCRPVVPELQELSDIARATIGMFNQFFTNPI